MINYKFCLPALLLIPAIGSCSTAADRYMSAEMGALLQPHNTIRSQHGLPALKWSPQLAGYAQQWANHLRKRNKCNMKHRPSRGRYAQQYGENLLWIGPVRWSDGRVAPYAMTPEMIIDSWADERNDYHYQSNSCRPGKICGHYTQIVWRDTQEVGCAKAVCRDQSQLWVCNYSPPGNYRGKKPY